MAKWWEPIAEYDAETKTWSPCVGTTSGYSSPWTPKKSARITKLRVIVNADAATSLTEHVQLRLKYSEWPVDIIVAGQGNGLQTVPSQHPAKPQDWEVDLGVKAGVPMEIEGRNVTADTPVGVTVLLYALMEG